MAKVTVATDLQNAIKGTRMPLVVFAPYPPAKSGIARYVDELMPQLLAEFDITLVLADDAAMPQNLTRAPRILLASEFRAHRAHFEGAPKLYHFGDNPDHCYMLELIARDPGTVVLHDFNLNYMHRAATLDWREEKGFRAAMEREYGAGRGADMQWQFGQPDCSVFSTYEQPLNGAILESATGVVAHSRYVQYKAAARAPRIPVWHVPHHVSPCVAAYSHLTRSAARAQLGLPSGELIVTALGFVTRAKKIRLILEALARLRTRLPPFRLVLAGELRPGEYDVDADIAEFGLQSVVQCTGYVTEEQFFAHLAACDVVANLRYPTGGETSGTLIRALGMGVPTLVLDSGPIGELPDAVVRKIAWNSETPKALADALYDILTDAPSRRTLGATAAAYVRDMHDIKKVAQRYSRILRREYGKPCGREREPFRQHFPAARATARRLGSMASNAAVKAEASDGTLWWRASTTPLGQESRQALVISPRPHATAELLNLLFGWPLTAITAMTMEEFTEPRVRERTGRPLAAHSFAYALAVVSAELPEHIAALLIRRLNASLCYGGSLVLETWLDLDEEPGSAPLEGSRLPARVTEAGFGDVRPVSSQDIFLSDLVLPANRVASGRTCACVAARKISQFALWRFMDEVDGLPMRLGGRIC